MKIEIRADGAHISGYVNATEKKSRPVITPHGKVIEEIEPRAFERAIGRAGEITLTVDHDSSSVYARTSDTISGVIMAAASVIAYTIGEGLADAAYVEPVVVMPEDDSEE